MSSSSSPSPGDIIEAHCTTCRLNLDCNVAAVHAGQVKQVQCRTCGNFVSFKPPVDMEDRKNEQLRKLMKIQEKKRKGPERTQKGSASSSVTSARWKELTDPVLSWQARPWDRHRSFNSGDFIVHKSHGMGHVESIDESEIIVLFREGLETISHNEPREE
jgi:hypothetical protein